VLTSRNPIEMEGTTCCRRPQARAAYHRLDRNARLGILTWRTGPDIALTSQVPNVRLRATSRVPPQTHPCFTAVLNEDQVRELLTSCETSLVHRLDGLRASLRTHANRAAAIWELLVLDALLKLGHVEYEQPIAGLDSSRPDFRIDLGAGRRIWIDATYLTERFVGNERRADLLRRRFGKEGSARGIPYARLWSRLDGDPTPAGFRRELPKERIFRAFSGMTASEPSSTRSKRIPTYQRVAICGLPTPLCLVTIRPAEL
jgi:hypothetical protein